MVQDDQNSAKPAVPLAPFNPASFQVAGFSTDVQKWQYDIIYDIVPSPQEVRLAFFPRGTKNMTGNRGSQANPTSVGEE